MGISQPTASRHLNLLRERGLVEARRDGQSAVKTVADARIIQALDMLHAVLASNLKSQTFWRKPCPNRTRKHNRFQQATAKIIARVPID